MTRVISGYLAICWFALVEQALAVVFGNSAFNVTVGQPFTITWADNDGPVGITLKNATNPSNLTTVQVIDSDNPASLSTWTPSSDLPTIDISYSLELKDSSSIQYSPVFELIDDTSSATSVTSSASLASSTANPIQTRTTTASDEDGDSQPNSNGLSSTGIKVGVALGGAVLVLVLAIFILYRRRVAKERRAQQIAIVNFSPDRSQIPGKAELPTSANKHEMMAEEFVLPTLPQQTPDVPGKTTLTTDGLDAVADQRPQVSPHFELEANPPTQRSRAALLSAKAAADKACSSNTEQPREPSSTVDILSTPAPSHTTVPATSHIKDQSASLFQSPAWAISNDDIRRLELEQARLEGAIRESERLIHLKEEKERVAKQLEALRRSGMKDS